MMRGIIGYINKLTNIINTVLYAFWQPAHATSGSDIWYIHAWRIIQLGAGVKMKFQKDLEYRFKNMHNSEICLFSYFRRNEDSPGLFWSILFCDHVIGGNPPPSPVSRIPSPTHWRLSCMFYWEWRQIRDQMLFLNKLYTTILILQLANVWYPCWMCVSREMSAALFCRKRQQRIGWQTIRQTERHSVQGESAKHVALLIRPAP